MMSNNNSLVITIIVHYQSPEECATLVCDLEKLSYRNHHIVVVDNQSSTSYYQQLANLLNPTQAILVQNKANNGYGAGINYGIQQVKHLKADFYQIINADTRVLNNHYLKELINIFEDNPQVALIGPCVKTLKGNIQNTMLSFINLSAIVYNKQTQKSFIQNPPILVPAEVINGVCFVIRSDAYSAVNGFDENFFMYGEETDLCYRLKFNNLHSYYWSGVSISHNDYDSRLMGNTFNWRDVLIRANQILFLKKRHLYVQSVILSILFSFSIIIKMLFFKIELDGLSLITVIKSYFNPHKFNKNRIK